MASAIYDRWAIPEHALLLWSTKYKLISNAVFPKIQLEPVLAVDLLSLTFCSVVEHIQMWQLLRDQGSLDQSCSMSQNA